MKKKENKKDSLFNVEITRKIKLKKELIAGVISTIVATTILYLTLVTYNYEITKEVIIWSFCTILLVTFTLRSGIFLISYSKKK